MTKEQIEEHYPIFKDWYLKTNKVGYMPSGAMLIAGWYEYCKEYNAMLDAKREPLVLEETDNPD